jgi:hypothetical protein
MLSSSQNFCVLQRILEAGKLNEKVLKLLLTESAKHNELVERVEALHIRMPPAVLPTRKFVNLVSSLSASERDEHLHDVTIL